MSIERPKGRTIVLTAKQEKFCKNIVSGMTNKDAYIDAYNTNSSEQVAYNEAYKLLQKKEIKEYIKSITEPLEDAFRNKIISKRDEQINFIHERIKICKEKGDETSLIRYTDMLNKIYGIYKTEEEAAKPENTVTKLDTSVLKKLSAV